MHADIRGEDVASVVLGMDSGATVSCEISYATRMEHERFPQTFVFVEGDQGSVELGNDYWIRTTTTRRERGRNAPLRRDTAGLIRSTTWSTPASSRATRICWRRYRAEDRLRRLPRTI